MDVNYSEWLNLVVRWFHIIAGISWIGSSFYFMWLDSHLEKPSAQDESRDPNLAGHLWMVHSGGFYRVEKRFLAAGQVPKHLHWFKYEALFTWLSGLTLLIAVYYFGGIAVDATYGAVSDGWAAVIGLAVLVGGWLVYDGIWISPLEKKAPLTAAVCFVMLVGVAYLLSHTLGGRSAYIHVGALLGTCMVANVWVRILPAQRQMIAATQAGTARDLRLAHRAKLRSVHNNYMTFPVVFIMISNHYPSTYGHEFNWGILAVLMLASAGVRHYLNHPVARNLVLLFLAAAAIATLSYVTA